MWYDDNDGGGSDDGEHGDGNLDVEMEETDGIPVAYDSPPLIRGFR